MENMGKQKTVSKVITAAELVKALQGGSVTIAQAQQMYNGVIPIGDNNGIAALYDINKQVIQPLVWAEQQHILGILSGRQAARDLVTILVPVTAVPGIFLTAGLTVPADELWYVNAVSMNCPGDAAAGFTMNWHCSLWTDPAVVPSPLGQSYHFAAHALANAVDAGNPLFTHTPPAGGAINQLDEFGPVATAWSITNKVPLLRLPGGTTITFTVLPDTLAPAVATACTLGLFGFVAKILVV